MQPARNLAWRLNWYRQSELEGALLPGRIIRQARDPYLIGQLTRHCADEARPWLWERTLLRLGLPAVRIFRSYQSFYLDDTGLPGSIEEVLALTHVFEHRVHAQFTEELNQPGTAAIVERYRRADERVYRQFLPFGDRIWDIVGLGEELAGRGHDGGQEECHSAQSEHSLAVASRGSAAPGAGVLRAQPQ